VAGGTVVAQGKFKVQAHKHYTGIVEGLIDDLSTIKLGVYADSVKCAEPGTAKVRFIHAAAGVPAVDVYAKWEWDASPPAKVFSDVAYGQTGTPTYASVKLIPPPTEPPGPKPTGLVLSANLAGTSTVVTSLVTNPSSGGVYTTFASGRVDIPGGSVSILASQDNTGECDQLQSKFDTQAYMGKWNQIASIPQFYETQCANAVAEYTLLATQVSVVNTCLDKSGAVIGTINGSATALPCQPAALTVVFPGIEYSSPNYLVHRTDYVSYAVIGSPNRATLFILSREAKMSQRKYDNIKRYAASLGYDVSRLQLNYNVIA
jgi:apolipoprotein D and lipocalin family protein